MPTSKKDDTPEIALSPEAEALATELRREFAALAAELRKAATEGFASARSVAAEGVASARNVASHGVARGEAAIEGLTAELDTIEKDIVGATRKRPWQALGIAALAGFVLATLIRR